MNTHWRWFSLISIAAALHAPGRALADSTLQDRAAARAMFDEGRRLAHAGNFVAACPKFQESQRIDPGIGTLFNLADCYEHTGRTASAWSNYLEVADAAMQAGEVVREKIARERAERLVPRLAHLVFALADKSATVSIKLDSTVLGEGALGATIPVDPGEHAVEASAASKEKWTTTLTIEEGESITVNVPELKSDATARAPAPEGPPAPATPLMPTRLPTPAQPGGVLEPRSVPKRPWQRPVAVGVGSLGVIGLGVGTYFGLRAQGKWSAAEPQCPSAGCTPSGHSAWSESRSSATASTIAFATGGGLLAAGLVLWLTAPKSTSAIHVGLAPEQVSFHLEL